MTMPADYSQQLQAYLQAWRQLLESAAALAAAMPLPGMVPGLPTMPPTTATAPAFPAPADHTQQLFGYLQAWRQYLEQTVGAANASSGGPRDETTTAHADRPPRPTEPVPPKDPGANRAGSGESSGSTGPKLPPRRQDRGPRNPFGGQLPTEGALRAPIDRRPVAPGNEDYSVEVPSIHDRQAAAVARGQQIPRPPALEFGQQITPLRGRVDPGSTPLPAKTFGGLFKGLTERTPGIE